MKQVWMSVQGQFSQFAPTAYTATLKKIKWLLKMNENLFFPCFNCAHD